MLIGLCVLIALIDLAQVPLLGKGLGAVGGALIYGASAVAMARGDSRVRWLLVAMPLIPIAVFTGFLGTDTRNQLVDTGMIAVFSLQLLAAILAGIQLRSASASHPGSNQGDAS